MAVNVGSLLVSLGLDSAEFKTGLSQAEKEFKRSTKRIEGIGNSMSDFGKKMSLAVTAPLAALGVTSIKAAVESNKAIKSVEATLASMGQRAGFTAEQLQRVASNTMKKSLYDDDEILQKVTNSLLTFGNVSGQTFLRAQQAAVDLSAKFGKDLQGSALMVGKALQDPTKGLTALTRAGISFSPAQATVIKSLVATGKAAQAQELILKELERQVIGSAQAMRAADPMAALRLSFGEFQEEIGKKLLPLLPRLTEALTKVLDAFGKLSPGMQEALIIGGLFAAALGPIITLVGAITSAIAPFVAGIKLASATAAAAGVQVGTLTLALNVVRAALLTFVTTFGPLLAVLAALGYALSRNVLGMNDATRAANENAIAQEAGAKASEAARGAAERLASAHGKTRAEALKAAQAERENTKQKIAGAKASLILAQAELRQKIETRNAILSNPAAQAGFAAGGAAGAEAFVATTVETQYGVNETRKEVARLKGRLKGLNEGLAALNQAIDPPAITTAIIDTASGVGADKGRGSRGSGPSASEIESRFRDELANYAAQALSAMSSMAKNADERAEYELRGVELARVRTLEQIKTDKEYSATQKARLSRQVEALAELEREQIERSRQMELERQTAELMQVEFERQREMLGFQADQADTQAERKRLALEILALEQQYRRQQLEMIAASATATDAEKKRAQAILASLDAVDAGERASASRANETDVERYLRELKKSPEQINEAMDRIRMDGLDRLNDGLVDAITGVKSLGAAFKDVAKQIVSDLLRIAIRKAIIEPLAGALFKGQVTGIGDGVKARALGGPVRAGMPYLVGERGPELMVPGSRGTVVSNRNLRGMGGGVVITQHFAPNFAGNAATKQDLIMMGQIAKAETMKAIQERGRRR